jgi:23S rRNA (uracil1939-C5)-methyltransferase
MSSRKRLSKEPVTVSIESLSHKGRGVTHVAGKTVFVDGGLPGEKAVIQFTRQHSRYGEARIIELMESAPERVDAKCEHYGICGGCSFQHASPEYQIAHKQKILLEQLQHIGGVQPEEIIPPLTGPVWGYRRRARLGVKYVEKKQKILVGFREKNSPFIADIKHCDVLHPSVGLMIEELQQLISQLSIFRQLPQIEVAVADNVVALVFRHLVPLTELDISLLKRFEIEKKIKIYLQPGGLDTVKPLTPEQSVDLIYVLPDHQVNFTFLPVDFIQINPHINYEMINRAPALLELRKEDNVLDLFCGLGNFSLPMARQCRQVTGVEGDAGLINRAKTNAERNNIDNVEFYVANLADENLQANFINREYSKVLLDPPRVGAMEIINHMTFVGTDRIVYVSCNPATLARDAGILVKNKGFQLQSAGVMDMFPHTTHIESIALFTH